MSEESIKKEIKKRFKHGRITCSEAFQLAGEFKITLEDVGSLLNECGIKITKCRLGCF